jgi:hypothetical protein
VDGLEGVLGIAKGTAEMYCVMEVLSIGHRPHPLVHRQAVVEIPDGFGVGGEGHRGRSQESDVGIQNFRM